IKQTPPTQYEQIITDCWANTLQQLAQCRSQLSAQTIHQSLQLILAAQNIYVIGMGVSALHATLLVNCAEPYLFRKIKEINAICGIERAFRYINLLNEEHTSELQSRFDLVCRLLLEKKKKR